MVPSNSTAKHQARRDAQRRVGSGHGLAVGTQSSRKRQLRITRNFAYYEKEESSTTPVGGRSFIAHKWKFYAETKISYKSLLCPSTCDSNWNKNEILIPVLISASNNNLTKRM